MPNRLCVCAVLGCAIVLGIPQQRTLAEAISPLLVFMSLSYFSPLENQLEQAETLNNRDQKIKTSVHVLAYTVVHTRKKELKGRLLILFMHLLLLPVKKKGGTLLIYGTHNPNSLWGEHFFFSFRNRKGGGQVLSKRHLLVQPVGAAVVDKREKSKVKIQIVYVL